MPKCMVIPKRAFGMMQVAMDGNLTFVRRKKVRCHCESITICSQYT